MLTFEAALVLRALNYDSAEYEERVYEWAVFGVTFIGSICTESVDRFTFDKVQIGDAREFCYSPLD